MSSLIALLHVSGQVHVHALANIGIPLYLTDRAGVFLWINRSAKTLLGDVVGRPISSVVAPEQISYARQQFARNVTLHSALTYDLTLLDSAGRRVPAQIHSIPLAADGSRAAVFGAALRRSAEPEGSHSTNDQPEVQLTGRQHATMLLLGDGLGTSEIAARLGISVETTRNHIRAVMSALGVHSRLEAVVVAHRIGLLPSRN